MPGETRADRANRIREPVRALVDRSSLQQAADAISQAAGESISIGAIRSLLDGRTPREPQLQIYEAWARAIGMLIPDLSITSGRPRWIDDREIGRIIREIRHRRGWSQQQLAHYLEIPSSQADVSRWEGGKRPGYDVLEAIARLVGEHAEIFQEGGKPFASTVRETYPTYGSGSDAAAAETLFEHFEGMVRRMGGEGMAPEELQLRKLDVTEGLKRLYAAAGSVPGWVYELEGRIKRGDL